MILIFNQHQNYKKTKIKSFALHTGFGNGVFTPRGDHIP